MRRVGAALLLAAAHLAFVDVGSAAALPDCANRTHLVLGADAASAPGAGVNGVSGAIHIPSSVNLNGQATSGADIVLYGSDMSHFVQFGWYVGYAGALPYASTPRVFFGQGSNYSETLTAVAAPLTPGTLRRFEMRRNEIVTSPQYKKIYAFLDGVQVFISGLRHDYTASLPRVVAETNWLCAEMTLDATEDAGPPYRTLQYHTLTGGYRYWLNNVAVGTAPAAYPGCWVNTRFNDEVATAFVYGPIC